MTRAHGVDLAHWEQGAGPAVLFIHETATGGEVWRALAEALGAEARAIAYDRRGWGGSEVPQAYSRTTIEEQSEDAAVLLGSLGAEGAHLCGAGLGAVVALDLLLRHPELVGRAVLIEPPLLAFLPDATEGLSADRLATEEALLDGGKEAAVSLYLSGALPYLGAGAERIPAELAGARERPASLFAELGAVPAWPLRPARLGEVGESTRIVVSAGTPSPLRRVAEELSPRLGGAEQLVEVGGAGLPHLAATPEIAGLLRSL